MSDSIFAELRRRNVFKVGIAYFVVGWLLIQVSGSIEAALTLPEWFDTLVVALLAIGLPIALIFAWAFEITPEGIKKESEINPEESITSHTGRKLDFAIIGLLVIVAGYFIYESRMESETKEAVVAENAAVKVESPNKVTPKPEGTSIAVLPFVNMSSDKEQEYFSDGISEEILNVLAKIPQLQVTSRSSAFAYKGTKINIAEVAKVLGVKNVLEGSVRKSGTKVRITAQLINADTDKHLWSESYDRELDDIFKVQDEISASIVDALKKTLGIELVKIASTAQTIDPEAYDLYLQGLKAFHTATHDSLADAVTAFESAINISPEFLMAKIKLAETFTFQVWTGSRFDREILDTADDMIKDVLAINPDLAAAYYVRAFIAVMKNDNNLARQFIAEAYRLNPNDANIITKYALYHRANLGAVRAKELFSRAQQIDPLNGEISFNYARYLMDSLHAFSEAEQALKQAIKINPNNAIYPFSLGLLYSQIMGNLVDAVKQVKLANKLDINDPEYSSLLSRYYLSLGDDDMALEYAEQAIAINPLNTFAIDTKVNILIYRGQTDEAFKLVNASLDNPDTVYRFFSKDTLTNRIIYLLLKDNKLDEAEALINKNLPELSNILDTPFPKSADDVGNPRSFSLLALVYQVQGKTEDAKKLTDRLKFFYETVMTKDTERLMYGHYVVLSRISALQSDDDSTLNYLEAAIDNGFLANGLNSWRSLISQSPFYLSLHQHPRYIALLERLETEMLRQRALLDESLAVE